MAGHGSYFFGDDPRRFEKAEAYLDSVVGDHNDAPGATNDPSTALGTVEKAPFYAVTVVPGNVGTFGAS